MIEKGTQFGEAIFKTISMKILNEEEIETAMAVIDAAIKKRAEKMPTEQDALAQMFEAYQRLKELGWNDAIYCPKDGTRFLAIESGSTGTHECSYEGKWPDGRWWVYGGDMWPSRPILWKPYNAELTGYTRRLLTKGKKCQL